MKRSNYLGILLLVVWACTDPVEQQGEKPDYLREQKLQGTAWQMDYSMEIHEDTSYRHVPKHWLRIKTFTQNRFVFTGYDFEQKEIAGMGGGTYSLRDSIYEEQIEFHHRSDFNGSSFQGQLYFDSLYLYQRGQVGELILEERWHRLD